MYEMEQDGQDEQCKCKNFVNHLRGVKKDITCRMSDTVKSF